MLSAADPSSTYVSPVCSERIRIRGTVQGVGFRPMVWRVARDEGLVGSVCNDGDGVLVQVHGSLPQIERFLSSVQAQCPPLATISLIERTSVATELVPEDFSIVESKPTEANTRLPADAATCQACLDDIFDAGNRRFSYPFTNCTHCGPRLSLVQGIPYDRANTTMKAFPLCEACAEEYRNPVSRRFHAQPNACPYCGPHLWLEVDGQVVSSRDEALREAVARIHAGEIVAIKGVGGVHLAVDAGNAEALLRLRQRKNRPAKPFALMARDVAQIRQWCDVAENEEAALTSSAAPVVLLRRLNRKTAAECQIAPKQHHLGFMLPYSPLHHLLMAQLERPIVLTSGNRSGDPQCIGNDEARERLGTVADALLLHDREIANRVDDSVVRRMAGEIRMLRRARGYAPQPLALPNGFPRTLDVLAMGGELKSTFCLLKKGEGILSQHMGDLENFATFEDYQKNIALYSELYQHRPQAIAVDKHPEYLSSKLGRQWAAEQRLPLVEVQHHHAHVAAGMAENGLAKDTAPVLGIVLDGLGYGDDGTLWGGEFLLADYRSSTRLACLRPSPLPGGEKAMREPWRNLWAQLLLAGIPQMDYPEALRGQPIGALAAMLERDINCPSASSCGRLFDAVAAALGICFEAISYEGQAAMELEALIDAGEGAKGNAEGYAFGIDQDEDLLRLDPAPIWPALLEDLQSGVPAGAIALRFHHGLANALVDMALALVVGHGVSQVVLSGGVFQNKTLLEATIKGLEGKAEVLTHRALPMNDGGLALGQAAVAAARLSLSRC